MQLDHGPHSVEFDNVRNLMGTEDNALTENGLYVFNIAAKMSPEETISHDDARKGMVGLLNRFTEAGWKPSIGYAEPRLRGEEAFRSQEGELLIYLPPDFSPSLDQWMKLRSQRWSLYAG